MSYDASGLITYSKSQEGVIDDGAPMVGRALRAEIGSPHDNKSLQDLQPSLFPGIHINK
jgi:hypothetical protein